MSILYKIKPLVFSDDRGDVGMDFEAETIDGSLWVKANEEAGRSKPPKYWNVVHASRNGWSRFALGISTIEEAKSVANKKHEELLGKWIEKAESEAGE